GEVVAGLGLAPGDAQPSTAAPGSDENRGTDELPGDGGRRGPRPRAEDAGVAAAARRRAGDAPGADGRDPPDLARRRRRGLPRPVGLAGGTGLARRPGPAAAHGAVRGGARRGAGCRLRARLRCARWRRVRRRQGPAAWATSASRAMRAPGTCPWTRTSRTPGSR